MSRWSPTVIARAPENAGLGLATLGQAAMGTYSSLEEMRDRRRQREMQQQQLDSADLARSQQNTRANMEMGLKLNEIDELRNYRRSQVELDIAKAGGEVVTGNAQPGSTVAASQAGQQESEMQRIKREAKELYPTTPTQWSDPTTGRTYRLDANRSAREKFMQERVKEITERTKATEAHQRALEVQGLRNKGQLDAARIRARASAGRGGGRGGGESVDGVTPTQMQAELKAAQSAMAGLARKRGSNMKYFDEDSDDYDMDRAAQWQQDSTLTVDRFRPENNPRMAAALSKYGMPETLTPFMDTDPIDEQEVQVRMGELTRARDAARNPAARKKAQELLNEYATQVNQRGMRR